MSGTGRRPRVKPMLAGFAAGVAIALVVGLMATINLTYGAPWAPTHTVTAQVSDADAMSVGSDVRIGGRLVGQVVTVQAAGDHTNITFHVDSSDWPLPADTSADVRLATLLGQKYIQLNPGHSTQLLADDGTIGLQATKPVVDFDQILNTFNQPTRNALTTFLRTVSSSVQGQEGTLQQLLPNLGDLSVHSQVPTQELVTRNSEFNNILVNLGTTADQLNTSRNDFAGVIDNLNSLTATLASNEGAAIKSYITQTDTLNLTTDTVLGNGYAAKLDSALKQVGTFATYLNSLLSSTIPQTQSFSAPAAGAQPSDNVNGDGAIPAKASIDLIYEIGSATSQGYGRSAGQAAGLANFWLRQNAQGVDPCGLLPVQCGLPTGPAAAGPSLPVPGLPGGLPQIPQVCLPLLPCVGGSGSSGGSSSGPTPPPPTPTPAPLPLPTPSLPVTISDDVHIGDFGSPAYWPERYR